MPILTSYLPGRSLQLHDMSNMKLDQLQCCHTPDVMVQDAVQGVVGRQRAVGRLGWRWYGGKYGFTGNIAVLH